MELEKFLESTMNLIGLSIIITETGQNNYSINKNVDAMVLHHASELITRLDELEKLYRGKK